MAGFSELIKNFAKTRDYVLDFFIYGFKVRGDFSQKSARTYDDEKRRVESWLGDYLRWDDSQRGRQISISVDSGHVPENPLYQAYDARSFTDNDIRLHFLLLDLLHDKQPRSIREITDALSEQYSAVFEEQTVRGKLKEYTAEGILIAEKRGKAAYFRLSDDTADAFLNRFPGLTEAVKFFSECGEFSIIGNRILKSAGLKNDLFLHKHAYIVHTLEDPLLCDLCTAIAEQRLIRLSCSSTRKRALSGTSECEIPEKTVIPLGFITSVQTGRRYLAAYVPQRKRFCSFRLDAIRSIAIVGYAEDYEAVKAAYLRNLSRCYGVSFGMRDEFGKAEPLQILFAADEQTEPFFIERLYREKRIGTVTRIEANRYLLTVDAFDPHEVMHWAKSCIGRILSVSGGTKQIRDRFLSDIDRMQAMYGGQTNDTVQ